MFSEKVLEGNILYKVTKYEEISFMCFSDADHPSNMAIRKQDEEITMIKNTSFIRHTINNVSCEDAGEYICSTITSEQEALSKLILLVKCKIKY